VSFLAYAFVFLFVIEGKTLEAQADILKEHCAATVEMDWKSSNNDEPPPGIY
jgi:hypothetical protein